MLVIVAGHMSAQEHPAILLAPARMPRVAMVDPRFVSYNIEMVEVTGGRFWKPYSADAVAGQAAKAITPNASPSIGLDTSLFQYRPPIDLTNPRLRNLAKGIGPAYVRVSGSWANRTYFQDDDKPAMKQPPAGFDDVLTRAEWKAVIQFARAVGAQIVTSFAISPGTRDANGVWTPTQAKAFLDYTKAIGGRIAAAEFMNEPTIASRQGAPAGYDAAALARDIKVFSAFLRIQSPKTLLLGPGGTGEGRAAGPTRPADIIGSEDIMKAAGPMFDVFSYHFYGALSRRCAALGRGRGVTLDESLSPTWLDRTNEVEAFYSSLRDRDLPGKPIWVTETAEAACGGDAFASEFADTFRFLNQLGTFARKGVTVVMHNTLAASDYGLLDEKTLQPRPNYWAAVLWHRMMGPTVLGPGTQNDTVRIYAHCIKQTSGGVAVVALNIGEQEHSLGVPVSGERFTLTAPDLTSTTVLLNGSELTAEADGSLPFIKGQPFRAGSVRLPARSITFLTMPSAGNSSCR